ncbi:hypothetical protein ACC786_14375 [Rhizobium ruizarguesonis]|uniref:hypothetical protein n=1 Tax=Rhizobium ruizarguesonis TaxID=2081791 RepID=UPI00102F6013|nr:hypothetical protein [Rhizobium ruizarguesonis]TAT91900.1 hypothetical protein ELI55_36425 [Rhizobium ruizarguesonis]
MCEKMNFKTIREYIQLIVGTPRRFSPEQALLAHGREWKSTISTPAWLVRGPKRNCFGNARGYALTRDDVLYVEGYALDRQLGIPLAHAWLIDEFGTVIDPTWDDPEENSYFGIAFKKSFVSEYAGATEGEPFLHPMVMRRNYGSQDDFKRGVETSCEPGCAL